MRVLLADEPGGFAGFVSRFVGTTSDSLIGARAALTRGDPSALDAVDAELRRLEAWVGDPPAPGSGAMSSPSDR